MLLQNLEHLGYRVASLAAVIYAAEKTSLLDRIITTYDSDEVTALKTSAFLSVSEYLGDMGLTRVFGNKPPSLASTMHDFGYAFVSNAIVLYAMDKLNLDEMIVKRNDTEEKRALELAVLFVIVQEISHKLLQMWGFGY